MQLNAVEQGLPDGPVLVLIHGLFGSASNLAVIARAFADRYRIISLDVRNHGGSPWAESMRYADMARDVIETLDQMNIGNAVFLGHSMGGKIAMATAMTAPGLVQALIVADIAPVGYRHDLLDYVEAMIAVDLRLIRSRADADRQLATAVPEAPVRQFLLQNLVRADDGGLRWRIHLEAMRDQMPELTGWHIPAPALPLPIRTAALYGTNSDYVGEKRLHHFDPYFSDIRPLPIDGAGHWLHAEKPREMLAALQSFLLN